MGKFFADRVEKPVDYEDLPDINSRSISMFLTSSEKVSQMIKKFKTGKNPEFDNITTEMMLPCWFEKSIFPNILQTGVIKPLRVLW